MPSLDTAISLTTLAEIKALLGESLQKDGIWIYCSSPSGATAATVEITDTTIILIITGGGSEGTNPLPFAIATAHRAVTANVATIGTSAAHKLAVGSSVTISGMGDTDYNGTFTVTAVDTTHFSFALVHANEVETPDTGGTVTVTIAGLITGINALTGWKSGAIYNGSADSTDLVVTGALSCLGSANEITLKIADDYFLTELINRASDLINRYCNRILKTTTYSREIYYGSGYDKLILDQFPVTRVTRLSVGRANSFSIKNTSTDANFCTVEVTATEIRLIVDGGDNDDDKELTLATYPTIDLLIAAIHALGTGWVCTTLATDTDSRDASELLVSPSMAVTDTAQAYLETVDDDITAYRLLKPTEARNEGIIEKPGTFNLSYEYFVSYVAGYLTIPYALEQACIYLVKYKYDQSKRDSGLKSEKFGEGADYSYTLQDLKDGLPAELLDELNMFKKRSF